MRVVSDERPDRVRARAEAASLSGAAGSALPSADWVRCLTLLRRSRYVVYVVRLRWLVFMKHLAK